MAADPTAHGIEQGTGIGMYGFMERALPDLPEHHRQRGYGDAHARGRAHPAHIHEVPSGTEVLDWTVPDEWNVRDAYIARRWTQGRGLRAVEPSPRRLQRAVSRDLSLDELRPRLHTHPDRDGLDSLPHVVLLEDLGLLRYPGASGPPAGRRLRGRRRLLPPPRVADLRRVLSPGRAGRRGAVPDARLPSVARKRQPVRNRGLDGARERSSGRSTADCRTASSSSPGRSAPSPGSRATSRDMGESSPARASPASATRRRSRTSAAATVTRGSTEPPPTCSPRPTQRHASSTSCPGAGTSASSTRRASTSLSGAFAAHGKVSMTSTTPRRTT